MAFFGPILVVCFLQMRKTKNSLNYRSFTMPLFCDIQSLKTLGCDRDLWPSRPRFAKMGFETSLETPPLLPCVPGLRSTMFYRYSQDLKAVIHSGAIMRQGCEREKDLSVLNTTRPALIAIQCPQLPSIHQMNCRDGGYFLTAVTFPFMTIKHGKSISREQRIVLYLFGT